MKRRLSDFNFIAWGVAAAGLGWWVGGWTDSKPSAVVKMSEPRPPAPPAIGSSRRQAWIAQVRDAGDPSAQLAAALALARHVQPGEFPEVLDLLRVWAPRIIGAILESAVLGRWVEIDPSAAMAWVLEHNRENLPQLARQWAESDAAAALVWYRAEGWRFGHDRFKIAFPIAKALVPIDREAALALAVEMDLAASSESSMHFHGPLFVSPRSILDALGETDPAWLLEKARGLPERAARLVRKTATSSLANRDFAGALEWAKGQPDHEDLISSCFQASVPAEKKLTALTTLPPAKQESLANHGSWPWETVKHLQADRFFNPDARFRLLERICQDELMSQVSNHSPLAIAAELEAVAPDLRGLWAEPLANAWDSVDAAGARAWAASLPEGQAREAALAALATLESERSKPPRAEPEIAVTATQLRAGYQNFHTFDPERRGAFFSQAMAMPGGMDADFSDCVLFDSSDLLQRTFLNDYPAEAAHWYARNAPEDVSSMARAAARRAQEEPRAASEWAAGLPPGGSRTWALWNAVAEWNRLDPKAAREWAASQKDADVARLARRAVDELPPE